MGLTDLKVIYRAVHLSKDQFDQPIQVDLASVTGLTNLKVSDRVVHLSKDQ